LAGLHRGEEELLDQYKKSVFVRSPVKWLKATLASVEHRAFEVGSEVIDLG
jgi:hypothetical protein